MLALTKFGHPNWGTPIMELSTVNPSLLIHAFILMLGV